MDNNSVKLAKDNLATSSENKEDAEKKSEKGEEKKISSISDNIGFNKIFILAEENQFISMNSNDIENNPKNKQKEEEGFENKMSIDLSDVNNKKLHNYLNEDLIDAIDNGLDDPIMDNQYVSDFSHNENDTNYSQNNLSNDNDLFNNMTNINNVPQFYPHNINLNSIHNSISFFPKANKKNEEMSVNNNIKINDNKDEKNKEIKKLTDYFGGSNPLDAPTYVPQKFKSLKFNQKPIQMENNDINRIYNNISEKYESDKKEEKCKKPFEIREGDWTCEFCYNLNFAFRTKCNRCGLIKDFLQIKNNLCINNNDNLNSYQNFMQSNFLGNNSNNSVYQFLNNTPLFSPNTSNYP
jgi:hypothetical protein